jgi:hypothetical protein
MERSWKAGSRACVDNGQLAATKSATTIAQYPEDKIETRSCLRCIIVGPVWSSLRLACGHVVFHGADHLGNMPAGGFRGRVAPSRLSPTLHNKRYGPGRSIPATTGTSRSLSALECTIRKRDCQ